MTVQPPIVAEMPVRLALAARLRAETRDAHAAAEAALALDHRVADRSAYGAMLVSLRRFYRPLEDGLAALTGWDHLTPPVDLRARRRALRLDEDLARLGIAVPTGDEGGAPDLPALHSLAEGLGCLYVLDGSALGGRIIARRARAALGDDVPVGFFSSRGRGDLQTEWRSLQAALDAFGAEQGPAAQRTVVAAAHRTFVAFGRHVALDRAGR